MLSEEEVRNRFLLLGHLLDKIVVVNGFFVTAGYGTFFGIWSLSREHLSPRAQITAFLFLLMSATLFIAWHLFGVLMMNLTIHSIGKDPPEGYGARVLEALRMRSASIAERFGMPVTLIAAFLAAIGVLILGYGLIAGLGA